MKPKQKISTLPMATSGNLMLAGMLMILGLLVASIQAIDQKSVKPSAAAPSSSHDPPIYIDDDSLEGSGGRGGIHDDLEKDPDYSGSGFGPDDEDAEPDHHSHGSHNSQHSQNVGGGASINTHTPTQTSSTISTPTTSNWTTTTSTTTTTATPTTTSTSSTTTTTTTTAATTNNNGPTNSISGQNTTDVFYQPQMPTFDPNVDTEGSGNGHDDDDYDNGDDFGGEDDEDDEDKDDYDDADRTIDGPATRTDDDVKPEDEIPTHQPDLNEDYKDTIDLDEDPKKEDEVTNVGGAAGGAVDVVSTRTEFDPIFGRGNDGSSNPEREPGTGGNSNVHALDPNTNVNSQPSDTKSIDHRGNGNEVVIMSEDDRTSSFFSQPGILAAVIGGAVVGLLCAILVVMFIVYRMRKKDEGSYALDEPKRSPANNSYAKNANNREFYA
ncbi:uncharacterized protein Dana_GF12095, isoform B [Drosophila ananassae]|uniref:Syndecan n=1 Tax=Drosophila ananassae TaxID=7217 RepID=A0A0P8YAB3_DROAN|nr:syndecan isoform X2 [Drosophila ananassae]KPU76038.1 uncharacterized protein Dana_GF12095, isoform B [Drosophila ananassae]